MKMSNLSRLRYQARAALAAALMLSGGGQTFAATGNMGTGIPQFGIYADPVAAYIKVWAITNATIPFPAGCSSLTLSRATLGETAYKAAIATLTAAKIAGLKVRFYSHGEKDGGCGVDYFELQD